MIKPQRDSGVYGCTLGQRAQTHGAVGAARTPEELLLVAARASEDCSRSTRSEHHGDHQVESVQRVESVQHARDHRARRLSGRVRMGAEQSTLDTFEPARKAAAPKGGKEEIASIPPAGELDHADNNGWTMCMHAAEGNHAVLLRRLLKAGCDSTMESTRTWGMFESGSTALQIAELVQSRLGIDRAEVIEMLRDDANSPAVQARLRERHAKAGGDTAAGALDDEARRLAEAQARKKVAAARERKAAAELRLATAQEAAAAEERRLRELESAGSEVDTAQSRLMAATEAAHRKALAEERRVQQAEQRAAAARTSSRAASGRASAHGALEAAAGSPSAADIAEMIQNQMVLALDQAAVDLLGGDEAALRTVSAARQEAETEAGQRLGERLSSMFTAKLGEISSFFRLADVNKDGVLTADEFQAALRHESVGIKLSATEMNQVMLFADKDKSGSIDIEEFLLSFR